MISAPDSIPDLIEALGGNAAVAKELGKGPSTVSEMKRNGSINVDYWPRLIEVAAEHGVKGVTAEYLMRLHTQEAAE